MKMLLHDPTALPLFEYLCVVDLRSLCMHDKRHHSNGGCCGLLLGLFVLGMCGRLRPAVSHNARAVCVTQLVHVCRPRDAAALGNALCVFVCVGVSEMVRVAVLGAVSLWNVTSRSISGWCCNNTTVGSLDRNDAAV